MQVATIVIGCLIALTGSGAFLITGDLATLFPVGLGLVVLALGALGLKPQRQSLTGHLAVMVTFVGMVFSAPALNRSLLLLSGEEVSRVGAVITTVITGILCLIHVTMSIRWFLARRRSESA